MKMKKKSAETAGMSCDGAINFALDKEVKFELEKCLADKPENELTDSEIKYLKNQREGKSRILNVRFTESEYREIEEKCRQFGYKNKSEYVRDCVRARVDLEVDKADFSETNRLLKAVGNNINQIAVRLYSTGNFYKEDMLEIKRGVSEIWQLLLFMGSKRQSERLSATSQTAIRPSTVYMSTLMLAEPTAQEQQRISEPSEMEALGEQKSLPTT